MKYLSTVVVGYGYRERRFIRGLDSTTVIGANAIQHELSERVHAISHGGIGMMMKLARSTGLINEIDRRVHLLKVHAPYQESDHVMAHVLPGFERTSSLVPVTISSPVKNPHD